MALLYKIEYNVIFKFNIYIRVGQRLWLSNVEVLCFESHIIFTRRKIPYSKKIFFLSIIKFSRFLEYIKTKLIIFHSFCKVVNIIYSYVSILIFYFYTWKKNIEISIKKISINVKFLILTFYSKWKNSI